MPPQKCKTRVEEKSPKAHKYLYLPPKKNKPPKGSLVNNPTSCPTSSVGNFPVCFSRTYSFVRSLRSSGKTTEKADTKK